MALANKQLVNKAMKCTFPRTVPIQEMALTGSFNVKANHIYVPSRKMQAMNLPFLASTWQNRKKCPPQLLSTCPHSVAAVHLLSIPAEEMVEN